MTIFPAKNRKGQPTGTWLVEVRKMEKGVSKTIRKRTKDYAEAKIIEANLRGEPVPKFQVQKTLIMPPTRLPEVEGISANLTDTSWVYTVTLRKLYEGAKSIYRGNKDEQQSTERLYAAFDIIGWDLDIKDLGTPAIRILGHLQWIIWSRSFGLVD